MYGLFLILLFYLLGCLVSALLDNFIPGSVIGMILLFSFLAMLLALGLEDEVVSILLAGSCTLADPDT